MNYKTNSKHRRGGGATLTLRIPIEQRSEFDEIYNIYRRAFELKFKCDLSYKSLRLLFPTIHSALLANALTDEFQFFKAVRKNKTWPKELPQPSILLRPKHIKFDKDLTTATIIYKPHQPLTFRIYPTKKQRDMLHAHELNGARLVKDNNDKFMLHCYIKVPIEFRRTDTTTPRYIAGIDIGEYDLVALAIVDIATQRPIKFKVWTGGLYRHLTRKMQHTTTDSKRYRKLDNKRRQILHDATTEVAKLVSEYEGIVVAMERLETLQPAKAYNKTHRWLRHNFPKRKIQRFIEYKARLRGIPTIYVSAFKSSILCGRCRNEGERNGAWFQCPQCKWRYNANVNAAINVAKRAITKYFTDSCSL